MTELGYRDYLGALQRYRVEHPHEPHLLSMSSYLVDYPFANRLFPGSLDVLKWFQGWGPTVILSDGDVVFQPRKVERSGIREAVGGHVLIYVHKEEELDDVARHYPAGHYVLVDDNPRILTAVKQAWGDRVTTVFPRAGPDSPTTPRPWRPTRRRTSPSTASMSCSTSSWPCSTPPAAGTTWRRPRPQNPERTVSDQSRQPSPAGNH